VGRIKHGSPTLLPFHGKCGFNGSGLVRGTGISHDGSRNLFFLFFYILGLVIGLTVHRNLISAKGEFQTLWTARGKEGVGSAVILINP